MDDRTKPPAGAERRRRQSARYPIVAPLKAKCSSWSSFGKLFSHNISATGLFIPTDREAETGEEVEVELLAPDQSTIRLTGRVAHVTPAGGPAAAGLGVRLQTVAEEDQQRYLALVAQAAALCEVRPASAAQSQVAPATPATSISPAPGEKRVPSGAAAEPPAVAPKRPAVPRAASTAASLKAVDVPLRNEGLSFTVGDDDEDESPSDAETDFSEQGEGTATTLPAIRDELIAEMKRDSEPAVVPVLRREVTESGVGNPLPAATAPKNESIAVVAETLEDPPLPATPTAALTTLGGGGLRPVATRQGMVPPSFDPAASSSSAADDVPPPFFMQPAEPTPERAAEQARAAEEARAAEAARAAAPPSVIVEDEPAPPTAIVENEPAPLSVVEDAPLPAEQQNDSPYVIETSAVVADDSLPELVFDAPSEDGWGSSLANAPLPDPTETGEHAIVALSNPIEEIHSRPTPVASPIVDGLDTTAKRLSSISGMQTNEHIQSDEHLRDQRLQTNDRLEAPGFDEFDQNPDIPQERPQERPQEGPRTRTRDSFAAPLDKPTEEETAEETDGIRSLPPLDIEIDEPEVDAPAGQFLAPPSVALPPAPRMPAAPLAPAAPQTAPRAPQRATPPAPPPPPRPPATPAVAPRARPAAPPPTPPPPPAPPASARQQAPAPAAPSRPASATTTPLVRPGQSVVVAMDFGTSRSSVSAVLNRQVHVLRLWNGGWDMASVVAFLENGSVVLDADARRMLGTDPQNAIASPKRLLGRRYRERDIEPYLASLAMRHSEGPDGGVLLHPHSSTYSISQVCAPIIYQLKLAAEQQLQHPVKDVVMTTPVSFDDRRYAALEQATTLAGLNVLEFVDEPTAAALTHRFDPSFNGLVAVYDFGGGTFDFSVVEASAADVQVVATAGDVWLGGDDFDEAIANAAANAFWREHKIELRNQVVQWQRLLAASEGAKRELSTKETTTVAVRDVALTAAGALHLHFPLARPQFAELAEPIIQRSIDTCREALELSDLEVSDLNAVYLSGGTSYIPAVREALGRFFGVPATASVPPERAVVTGAAVYAALLDMGSISE